MLKVGTLFSGGLAAPEFALRYESIEHEVVFACEIDKYARKQYLEFHSCPKKEFYHDVKDIDGTKYYKTIDLLVWGSPCQDLSLAGKRKGFEGSKSSLFRIGARIQDEIKPTNFIFENVTGLLSSNGGADYQEVVSTFREQGYHLVTLKMNTKDYGIPQNRERVFIVGFLDVDKYHNFREPTPKQLKIKLRDLLQKNVDKKYFLNDEQIKNFTKSTYHQERDRLQDENICTTLLSRDHKSPKLVQVGNIDQKGHNSLWGRVYDPDGLAPTLNANGGGAGAKTGLYQIKSNTKCGYELANNYDCVNLAFPGSNTRRGRVGKEVSQTLDCGGTQGVIYDFMIRRLTPFETFLLQGVKAEDIKLINSDTQSYKISGNAISVNVMQELLKALYKQSSTQKNSLFDFASA